MLLLMHMLFLWTLMSYLSNLSTLKEFNIHLAFNIGNLVSLDEAGFELVKWLNGCKMSTSFTSLHIFNLKEAALSNPTIA